MSRKNVEVVRRAYGAWVSDRPVSALDFFAEDAEFAWPAQSVDASIFRGLEAVRAGVVEWTGAFDDYGFEVEQVVDAGDQVLVSGRQHGRGKSSGVTVDGEIHHVWTLQDGKVVRLGLFLDETEAREAAGLGRPPG